MLTGMGETATVIDYSAAQIDMIGRFGFRAYYGDATRPDLLHAAGVDEAKILVIAIDGKEQITELAHYMHMTHPHVHVIARAVDRTHVYDLWHAGCRDIIRETYDSSLRMGRSAYQALGHSLDTSEQMADAFNEMDRKGMIAAAEHHIPGIRGIDNDAFLKAVTDMRADWEAELDAKMKAILAGVPAQKAQK
jgi:CPA2 family monovalent cation:H+ antiporter-2